MGSPRPKCPTAPRRADGSEHTIIGCGSTNTSQDQDEPQLWDCLDCGIWFDPEEEQS